MVSQYSKCPSSSEKPTLKECAAQGTRVCSLDVAYIGWKAYGVEVHVEAVGLKLICANPLAMLAVIAPTCEVVASMTIPCRPSGVSCRITTSTSPGLTKKVSPGMVKNLAKLRFKGSAGACETPLVVTKA